MAKDPAFLFYPGDSSNDTQFMNRLERGAYFDLVKSQRIFHGFTTAQLRKILGNDFEAVWPALELVLAKENDTYFIEWLRKSFEKRDLYSKKQSERSAKRWASGGNATALPQKENEIENEIGIKNEDEIEKKLKTKKIENFNSGLKKEKDFNPLFGKMIEAWKLWLKHKPKKFKNENSEAIGRKKFFELCGGEDGNAFAIVENSIANGWAGLFPINQKQSNQIQQTSKIETMRSNVDEGMRNFLNKQNLSNGKQVFELEAATVSESTVE